MQESRRTLLQSTLGLPLAVLQAAQHAHQVATGQAPRKFDYLDAATAADIEALAAEIIPTGQTPGAREAGVIYFIDRALATFDQEKRTLYRDGLRETQQKARAMFPGAASLAALSGDQRIALLHAIESAPFFEQLRRHTIMGFFANPSWGGNRDRIGWKLIGFEDRGHFEPPFGWYDDPKNAGNP